MPELELADPHTLQPHPRNARQGDVGAITEMIRATGWHTVVTLQASSGQIVAGWHRTQAACWIIDAIANRDEDWMAWAVQHPDDPLVHGVVPVERKELTDEEATAKMIADNRGNDLAAYDDAQLALLLQEMATGPGLEGTGWSGDGLDDFLGRLRSDGLLDGLIADDGLDMSAAHQRAHDGYVAVSLTYLPEDRATVLAYLDGLMEKFTVETRAEALLRAAEDAE